MKKLLLITVMFIASSVWSMEVIDQDERMTVYCISDYVVIVTHLGGVEQLMAKAGRMSGHFGTPTPMQCGDYEK